MDEPIVINRPVALMLSPEHLNVIVGALGEIPFKHAQPVMNSITEQVRAQLKPDASDS